MFVPLSEPEKQSFLTQTHGCLIPGYTGHCPKLKFQFGRCFGANTKDIIQELKDSGVLKNVRREQYRSDDPGRAVLTPIPCERDQSTDHFEEIRRREAKYILGYTGYIPGLNFRYGKSYGRSADESMQEFGIRQYKLESKCRNNDIAATNNANRMKTIRSRDEVARALSNFVETPKFKERTISSECPPIAGYTGHIPRVKGNEASLSKRFNCVAKQGFATLQEDRNRRTQLSDVEKKIKNILDEAESRYK